MNPKTTKIAILLAAGMIGLSLFYGSMALTYCEMGCLKSDHMIGFGTYDVGTNRADQWAFSYHVSGFDYIEFSIGIKVLNGSVPVDIYLTTDRVMIDPDGNSDWFELGTTTAISKKTVHVSGDYTTLLLPDSERQCSGDNTYTLIFTSESPDLIRFEAYVEILLYHHISITYFSQMILYLLIGLGGMSLFIAICLKNRPSP